MLLELKAAIWATGRSQRQIAAASGIRENRLSAIVRGWVQPRLAEREALARAVNRPVHELFAHEISAPADACNAKVMRT